MPVRFKGLSEYDRNFKLTTLAAEHPDDPAFASRWAGLRSDELGISKEPSFPSKRRVPYHNPQISKSFQWLDSHKIQEKEQVRGSPEPVKIHLDLDKEPAVEEGTRTPDAPRLLKQPSSHSAALREESPDGSSQVKRLQEHLRKQKNDRLHVSRESPTKEHRGGYSGSTEMSPTFQCSPVRHTLARVPEVRRIDLLNESKNHRKTTELIKKNTTKPLNRSEKSRRPAEQLPEKADKPLNGVHRVLQKKAGVKAVPLQHPLRISEYKKQFDMKSRVDSSPLLAAEQVVYNKNQAVPPFKVKPVNAETEYNSRFKGSPPAKGPKLRKDWEDKSVHDFEPENQYPKQKENKKRTVNVSHTSHKTEKAKVEQNETEKIKILRERLVQQLDIPARGYRKVKSEYSSNFRSPSDYRYKHGAWVRANKEMLDQVKELRDKAAYYKHRAQGTHFSRDHLNQILSANNRVWDVSSNSSSEEHVSNYIKALDLAGLDTTSKNEKSHDSRVNVKHTENTGNLGISEDPTMPVIRRRLVWDEEEDNESGHDTGTPEERADSPLHPPSEQIEDEEADEVHPETVEERITKRLDASKINSSPDRFESASISSEADGRLPTPQLKTFGISQRTHHDLTTPAAGGALLVSPPKHHRRVLEEKKRDSSEIHLSPNKPVSKTQKAHSKPNGEICSQSPPAAGVRTVDPIPLRLDEWPSKSVPDRPPSVVYSNPASGSPIPRPSASLPQRWSPSCRIHGALRDPEFQHNGDFGFPAFYKASQSDDPGDDFEDDRLSQISARSAASSSFASQILERAQKRKEHFWGKK
uniref:Nuclear protein MDM1 n=1 Tax=Leptobrachium leishanense TaxID=445787 RepID=A0A8C5QXX8_9ANUR